MDEYPSNSNRSREESNIEKRDKIEAVASGKLKQKSDFQRFASIFVTDDVISVRDYIFQDVLIPAVKKAISDIVTNGIDMILYGEDGRNKQSSKYLSSKVSYRSFYDSEDRSERYRTRKQSYNYDDIVIETRSEAEEVLDRILELMDCYHMVSVADFYDLSGVSGKYTDNNYGWTLKAYPNFISETRIVRTRDGYVIKLPRVVPID